MQWMRQQLDWMPGSFDRKSSLRMSMPPSEASVSIIPRSNRSYFLSSLMPASELKLLA